MRRDKAALDRRKLRDLIRMRRDIEAKKSNAGIWSKQAEDELKSKVMLPNSLLSTVKTIIICSILTFIYVSWLSGHKTVACQNEYLINVTTQDRFLYLFYWSSTFLHLFSLVVMFSCLSKASVSRIT